MESLLVTKYWCLKNVALNNETMIGTISANTPESMKTLGDKGQCHFLCNYDHVSAPHFCLQSDLCHISLQVFASSWTEAAWGGCCHLWQHLLTQTHIPKVQISLHIKAPASAYLTCCMLWLGTFHLRHLTIFLRINTSPFNRCSCCFISEAPKLCDKRHWRHSGNKLRGSSLLFLQTLSLLWYSTWKLEGLREREKPEPRHNASLKSSAPSADD